MFRVGQLITGNSRNEYSTTSGNALMIVNHLDLSTINVKIVGVDTYYISEGHIGDSFNVDPDFFEETTVEEFKRMSVNCVIDEDLIDLYQGATPDNNTMLCDMNTSYIPTKEEMDKLIEDAMFLSNKFGYHFTIPGLKNLFNEFFKNKGWLINTMKNSPNYAGNFQIVWDDDFPRDLDIEGIRNFARYIASAANNMLVPYVNESGVKLSDLDHERADYRNIIADMQHLSNYSSMKIALDEHPIEFFINELSRIEDNILKCRMLSTVLNGENYTTESYQKYKHTRDFSEFVNDIRETFTNKNLEIDLNQHFPTSHAHEGQKITKPVRKVLDKLGFTKIGNVDGFGSFEQEFAKFADAIAITTLKRRSVISVNPIDFLTMSFGNSWQSCHTIDKRNIRRVDGSHTYSGMRSGGTISYMLDGASMVYYTVDNSVTENYQLVDKIQRNMFHFGYDKLIQGRVYPQSNDGDTGLSDLIRNHVQEQLVKCFNQKISWVVNRGTSACTSEVSSTGSHYRDYEYFSTCNVSYMKIDGVKHKFPEKVRIGHPTVCPSCGNVHNRQDNVECRGCEHEHNIICSDCGHVINRDSDFRIIDERTYCLDCRPRTGVQPTTEEMAQLAG